MTPPIDEHRTMIVSADSHCGARPETYREYIDPSFRYAIDELVQQDRERTARVAKMLAIPHDTLAVIDPDGAIASGGTQGAWELDRRLAELDREGIAAEVLFPNQQCALMPFFSVTNRPASPELRAAGARAYHRWLAEFMGGADGRLVGVADPAVWTDLDSALREVRWAAANGFVAVSLPGAVIEESLPSLSHSYYEPLWEICAELGLVLSVHAGHGHRQGELSRSIQQSSEAGSSRKDVLGAMHGADNPLHRTGDLAPRRSLWELMLGGVFDRYPELTLVLTELHGDWIPETLAALDRCVERGHVEMSRRPSEYWQTNAMTSLSSPARVEVEMRHKIGVGRLVFGTDFVQPESTWPNTQDWIRTAFAGVAEDEVRAILGENAVACYKLDRSAVQAVASRVGPLIGDLLGPAIDVDPAIVQDFDLRAGFHRATEIVDADAVEQAFEADFAAAAGGQRGAVRGEAEALVRRRATGR